MCPSAWVAAGPVATRRTVHVAPQRIATVLAPASVATRRSPGFAPAALRALPRTRRTLFVPCVGDPGAPRSAKYASRAVRLSGANPRAEPPHPVERDAVEESALRQRGELLRAARGRDSDDRRRVARLEHEHVVAVERAAGALQAPLRRDRHVRLAAVLPREAVGAAGERRQRPRRLQQEQAPGRDRHEPPVLARPCDVNGLVQRLEVLPLRQAAPARRRGRSSARREQDEGERDRERATQHRRIASPMPPSGAAIPPRRKPSGAEARPSPPPRRRPCARAAASTREE